MEFDESTRREQQQHEQQSARMIAMFLRLVEIEGAVMCKKGSNWRGILGVITKFSININPFPLIPLNFGGNKNFRF